MTLRSKKGVSLMPIAMNEELLEGEREMRDSSIDILFREEPKRLSKEQERLLAYRIRNGDREAFAELVQANTALAANIARKFYDKSQAIPLEDLTGEAVLGLCEAAEKFDPQRGRFSTFATKTIVNRLNATIFGEDRPIRLPAHIAERLHKSIGQDTLEEILAEIPTARPVVSLDTQLNPVTELPLSETIKTEEFADKVTSKAFIDAVLDKLSPRERYIVEQRIVNEKTLQEVAEEVGITREGVRQIQKQAMKKLKKLLGSLLHSEKIY